MAHLASKAVLGFFPTPTEITPVIASWFSAPAKYRVVDPAAGDAKALSDFVDAVGTPAEKWAIELSPYRAEEARKHVDIVLPASFYVVRWSSHSVSLVYNNPPYDISHKRDIRTHLYTRHELEFVRDCTARIVRGGHQVAVVPRKMLGDLQLVRHLVGYYDQVMVRRFPNELYGAFNQIVIFAIGRHDYKAPTDAQIEAIYELRHEEHIVGLLPLEKGNGQFVIPQCPRGDYVFEYPIVDSNLLVTMADRISPLGTDAWRKLTHVQPVGAKINPAVAPKIGHLSMQITSNDVGSIRFTDMAAKGTVRKIEIEEKDPHHDEKGTYTHTSVRSVEKLQARISIVKKNGDVEIITDTDLVGSFITDNASRIGDILMARNVPTYDFKPTDEEKAVVARIGLGLASLPGRKERGLFPMQKHMSIAGARTMKAYRHCFYNFEMGTGKTATAIGAAELMGQWPVLTVVPPHMVWKWLRTWEEASDERDPVVARVITRAAQFTKNPKVGIGKWIEEKAEALDIDLKMDANDIYGCIEKSGVLTEKELHALRVTIRKEKITEIEQLYSTLMTGILWSEAKVESTTWFASTVRPLIESLGTRIIGEPERFQVDPIADNDTGGRVRFIVDCHGEDCTEKVIKAVRGRFSTRASKKSPKISPVIGIGENGLDITIVDKDDYTLFDFFKDLDAGRLGTKAVAIMSTETAKCGTGVNEDIPAYRIVHRRVRVDESKQKVLLKVAICPTCGGIHRLFEVPHFCDHLIEKQVLDSDSKVIDTKQVKCGGAMFEMSRIRREGAARVIQRKFKDRFILYISDEIHKMKGGDNEIGGMDGRLCSSIKYSLALTGTIFGGAASSIFFLLYRRNRAVRDAYDYRLGKTQWTDHFGLWERRWEEQESEYTRSKMTAQKRWKSRSRELPGISPAVIRYLLPITLFGKITDLGYELPKLHEEIDALDMTESQKAQYDDLDVEFLSAALGLIDSDKDSGGVSAWFNNIRYRPSSAFRHEVARYESKKSDAVITYDLPAVITADEPYLPKEKRLAKIVRENISQGKKTLVFLEQTGTRDIQDRVMQTLNELVPHARVQILRSKDMKPAKREAWIKSSAPQMDVLITNPALVETGLDLVMFSDIRFFELPLSLYTLWQAMRRVWRLGQEHEVTCGFLVYKGTVEMALLQRVGAKLKAAQLLYGDEASGAIVETDESDIQNEIVRAALAGKSYEAIGDITSGLVGGLFNPNGDKEYYAEEEELIYEEETIEIEVEVVEAVVECSTVPLQLSMFGFGPVRVGKRGRHIKS